MNLQTLRQMTPSIKAVAAKHGAENLRVFGSVARGDATARSDVDLLVSLAPEVSLLGLIALRQDLSDLIGTTVDVVPDDSIAPLLERRILSEAIPL